MEAGHFKLSRERVDVAGFVSEVVEQLADLAEGAGVRLELKPPPAHATVFADALRLRQVLINLVSNAIKFSDGRGTVTLEVEAQADAYRFAVRDEGIGIAEQDLDTVFVSFEQVHKGNTRKYGGTGLGLSIARTLVRMHGGDMWVESRLGHGSAFFFRIPKDATTGEAPSYSMAAEASPQTSQEQAR
jgi:signal transduction histidine kinase